MLGEELERIRERLNACNSDMGLKSQLLEKAQSLDSKSLKIIQSAEEVSLSSNRLEGFDELMKVQSLSQILKWIQAIQMLDTALSESLEGDERDAWWSLLPSLFDRLKKLRESLLTSGCSHLKTYADRVYLHWKETLTTHFDNVLIDLVDKLQWPQIIQKDSEISLDPLIASRFTKNYAALDYITGDKEAVNVLVAPLQKRFKFHFSGNKKTNSLSKPEWYIRQIWKWMKDSEEFFGDVLSPSSHTEFIRKLLQILNTKLGTDVRNMIEDPALFGHAIDEILGITSDILNYADLDSSSILPISVLCVPEIFPKWIDLERKLAFEKLDRILLDDSAWCESESVSKVSVCAAKFIVLLTCMNDRYRNIGVPELQMEFIELQKELLEDLRLRFVQISREEQGRSNKYCLILNSARHIVCSVSQWSDIPFFIKLENDLEHGEVGLLHVPLGRLDFVVNDMVKSLGDLVYYEVKAQSLGYVYKNWNFSIPAGESLSSESLPLLQTLLSLLNFLQSNLREEDLFPLVGDLILSRIRDLILNDVILENKFSYPGCLQLTEDITKGFIPIFNELYIMDAGLLDSLTDISTLLKLNNASATLLKETLQEEKSFKKVGALLKEFKLRDLNQSQVLSILSRRILSV